MDAWEYELSSQKFRHKSTKRKVLIALALVAVILLIVLGVILAVVLGTKNNDQKLPKNTTNTKSEILTIAYNIGFRNPSTKKKNQNDVSSYFMQNHLSTYFYRQ